MGSSTTLSRWWWWVLLLPGASVALVATRMTMVFSGIVEEMGTVVSLTSNSQMTLWDGSKGAGTELVVKGNVALKEAYVGCSIAVDGVCLTATALKPELGIFKVGLAPETLRRTTLGERGPGDQVNLERSLEGRNSGHYVQGHVDGVATLEEKWVEGDSLWLRLRPPKELTPFIVPKGYVAVDGTSLTVCDVDPETFTLMLIGHTQKCIVLPTKSPGDHCNVEVDVMAKYAQNAYSQIANLQTKVDALEARLSALEECSLDPTGTDCTGLD